VRQLVAEVDDTPSRGIERLFRPLDVSGNVAVLDRVHHHQIDLRAENPPEVFEKPEVGIDASVGVHRAEVDQEINVAVVRTEVPMNRGAKRVESPYPTSRASLGNVFALPL
jgi:hypothetical protein